MMWAFSTLNTEQISKIKELEEKLGITLIAFSNSDIKYADLSEEKVNMIKEAEKELKISLVAVNV